MTPLFLHEEKLSYMTEIQPQNASTSRARVVNWQGYFDCAIDGPESDISQRLQTLKSGVSGLSLATIFWYSCHNADCWLFKVLEFIC